MDPAGLFVGRDESYVEFANSLDSRVAIRTAIESDPGVRAAESAVTAWIDLWWDAEEPRLDKLQSVADLVALRREFMHTFHTALEATTLLDRFAISGVIAAWWGKTLPDLKALATIGYKGLVDAWVATVLDALEEEKAKIDPLDHKVARALIPEYLEALADLQTEVAELDATIKAATATPDEDDDGELEDSGLSAIEIKTLRSKLTLAKRTLKAEKQAFASHLTLAAEALNVDSARTVVLTAMEQALFTEAEDRVSRHRRLVISAVDTWWVKYATPLFTLEQNHEAATPELASILKELGYA